MNRFSSTEPTTSSSVVQWSNHPEFPSRASWHQHLSGCSSLLSYDHTMFSIISYPNYRSLTSHNFFALRYDRQKKLFSSVLPSCCKWDNTSAQPRTYAAPRVIPAPLSSHFATAAISTINGSGSRSSSGPEYPPSALRQFPPWSPSPFGGSGREGSGRR